MSHDDSPWVMMSHHKSQWVPMSHHSGQVDRLLSYFEKFRYDRPLSALRSSAFALDRLFWQKDRLLLLGSSALTHGSSAFYLDRLLWSFSGSSAFDPTLFKSLSTNLSWQWKYHWQWKMSIDSEKYHWQWKLYKKHFSLSIVVNIIDSKNCINNIFHCQLTFFTVNDIFYCQLTFFTVNDIFHCQVDCEKLTVKIVLAEFQKLLCASENDLKTKFPTLDV